MESGGSAQCPQNHSLVSLTWVILNPVQYSKTQLSEIRFNGALPSISRSLKGFFPLHQISVRSFVPMRATCHANVIILGLSRLKY